MNRAETFKKIKALIDDPRTTERDLAGVIEEDQILTEGLKNVIKDLGFPPNACTLMTAIHLLGFDAIRSIVIERPGQ